MDTSGLSLATSLALLPGLFLLATGTLICFTIYKIFSKGWNTESRTLLLLTLMAVGIIVIIWAVIATQ